MGSGEAIPVVRPGATLLDATIEMSRKRYGCTAVVDVAGMLIGAFTDGDVRRSFVSNRLEDDISLHMTTQPLTIGPDALSTHALKVMNDNGVTVLFVCRDGRLEGVIHMHDILRAGVA